MEFTPWSISPPPLQDALFFFCISLRKPLPFTLRRSSAALSPQESPAEPPNLSLALWVLSIKRESLMVAFHLSSSIRLKGTPGVLSAALSFFFSFLLAFGTSAASSAASSTSHFGCSTFSWAMASEDFRLFFFGRSSVAAEVCSASSSAASAAAASSSAEAFLFFFLLGLLCTRVTVRGDGRKTTIKPELARFRQFQISQGLCLFALAGAGRLVERCLLVEGLQSFLQTTLQKEPPHCRVDI
mmetsp:Transcript_65595/g.170358  ORF Transcript_65595/g.170358 Transcript_65595/m.170358 type:complete len:242 (+) Transcript_65595:135-860(+)